MGKYISDKIDQVVDFNRNHFRISGPVLVIGRARSSARSDARSRAGFDDRLGHHFERKTYIADGRYAVNNEMFKRDICNLSKRLEQSVSKRCGFRIIIKYTH